MREYAPRLGQPGAPRQMTLVVSFRSRADLICQKELEMLQKTPNVRVVITLSREDASQHGYWHGRLTESILSRALEGSYGSATYMTCGPQAIMDLTVQHLKSKGVADEHVKLESFES
jgi:ferredoxin-NADP reductase